MKNLALLLALFGLFTTHGLAQTETIFGNARAVGGFGAPIVEIGLNDDVYTSIGAGGGLIINGFFIGGYGMAAVDFDEIVDNDETFDNLEFGHGGLWMGFNLWPYKVLHFYGSGRLGWGAIDIQLDNGVEFEDLDQIFVLTPEAGLELNLTRWLRLAGTVGYRFVDGVDETRGYREDDFEGLTAGITLRIGGFGHRQHRRNDWQH